MESKRRLRRLLFVLIVATGLMTFELEAFGVADRALRESTASAATAPPAGEALYFSSNRPENWDLYLFDAAGAAPRRLTDHPALDYDAAFSPDGRWLVFTSERDGNPDLWAIDIQASRDVGSVSDPVALTSGITMEAAATFSPDGKSLAFVSTREGSTDIYTMPFRPGDPSSFGMAVNLTRGEGANFRPAFSPDGSLIAFASDRQDPGRHQLYVMKTDGSDVRRLTEDRLALDGSPVWARDGASLFVHRAIGREKGLGNGPGRHMPIGLRLPAVGIVQISLNGSPLRAITPASDMFLSPALTGDGRVIASKRTVAGWRIVSMSQEGTGERLESDEARDYFDPAVDIRTGRIVAHGAGMQPDADLIPGLDRPLIAFEAAADRALPDRRVRLMPIRAVSPAPGPPGKPLLATMMDPKLVLAQQEGSPELKSLEVESGDLPLVIVSWAPDGEWFICMVGAPFAPLSADADIWRVKADGSGAVNLTADSPANDGFPRVSFDGRHIVFRSGRDGNHEIYVMGADGSNPRRMTDHEAADVMPTFGPRDDRIAFVSTRDGGYGIYELAIQEDGSAGPVRRLTDAPGTDVHPFYSPDGRWIVFASDRGGYTEELLLSRTVSPNPQPYGELWAMRISDGHVERLTHDRWEDGLAVWVAR